MRFDELLEVWDGEEVAIRYDAATGAWMFVAVHSTTLGPAMGGTRLREYPDASSALDDVLRLAGAMTVKQAAASVPFGGGKAVIAVREVPHGDARRELLLRYADLVRSLGGTYVTAADMNTGEADMDVIAERCPHVLGRSVEHGGSGDPGPSTAVGVFHGVIASLRHVFGSSDPAGRTVVVQGVGSVGAELARRLHGAGATVVVADTDPARIAAVPSTRIVDPADALSTRCDVLAPCATGGAISEETIPTLGCRIVAGAANNQLRTGKDAERLAEAGILYAPDFVINAGGVIHLAGIERLGWSRETLAARLAGIGDTLTTVFETADREGITTETAARALADERLAEARARQTNGFS
jgi:leucine dehydrogenase